MQYVNDVSGNTQAVQLPINEWNKMIEKTFIMEEAKSLLHSIESNSKLKLISYKAPDAQEPEVIDFFSESYGTNLKNTFYSLFDSFITEWESVLPEHKFQGYSGKINIQDIVRLHGENWALNDNVFVFDSFTEESFAYFGKGPDNVSIRNWSSEEDLFHLDLDTIGYLRMAIAMKGFRLWQHIVLSFRKNEIDSCPICKDYEKMMPELFDDYLSIDELKQFYLKIRI